MNNTKQRHGKINNEVLVKAIVAGKTYREAGKLAGYNPNKPEYIEQAVSKKIKNNQALKRSITEQYEALEQRLMGEIEERDMSKAAVNQLIVGMAVVRDKIQLLKGDPTQNIAVMPRMVINKGKVSFKAEDSEQRQIEGK